MKQPWLSHENQTPQIEKRRNSSNTLFYSNKFIKLAMQQSRLYVIHFIKLKNPHEAPITSIPKNAYIN